jgi:hypothetical protein
MIGSSRRHPLIAGLTLVACLSAAPARSKQVANASARKAPDRARGEFRVDARDFGLRAERGFDNGPALQAAHDALASRIKAAATGPGTSGTVFIPGNAQPYLIGTSVYVDHPWITFEGEGSSTYLLSGPIGDYSPPIFVLGLNRPKTLGGPFHQGFRSLRPDLFGVLDATAAPRRGQRWGFRSYRDAFIQSQGSPFACGGESKLGFPFVDNWAETQTLTIECALEGFANGKIPPSTTVLGIGDGYNLFPFILIVNEAGDFSLTMQGQAERFGPAVGGGLTFPQAARGGVQRLTIQIDLANALVIAFMNGIQVYAGNLQNKLTPGLHFRENDYYPFYVAGTSANGGFGHSSTDFALYGMAMSRTLRYNDGGLDGRQVRRDGKATTDAYRYFDDGSDRAALIGYFAFDEDPAKHDCALRIVGGGGSTPAYLCYSKQTTGGLGGQAIRDMRLGVQRQYGAAILLGQVLDTQLSGLEIEGGYYNIANMNIGANYTISIDRCSLSTYGDSVFYGFGTIMRMRDCTIRNPGRAGVRVVGSNSTIDGLFIGGANRNSEVALAFQSGDNGGVHVVRNLLADLEGGGYLRAGILCERSANGTVLRLEDVALQAVGGVPAIELDDMSTAEHWAPARLILDNFGCFTDDASALVQVDGPRWSSDVRSAAVGIIPNLVHTGRHGNGTRMKFREPLYTAPPRWGSWYAGAHALEVPAPADGQFTEWRCAATGTYGTSNPPRWKGLQPIQISPMSLSAYVVDHTSGTIATPGGTAYGWLSDHACARAMGGLFGNTASEPPKTLQYGLALGAPNKVGRIPPEPKGGGYERVTMPADLTSFPPAREGVKSNGVAINWPTPTADWGRPVGVFATDGQHLIAYWHLAAPTAVGPGSPATSIPVGGLTLRQTPTNINGFLTQHGWGKVYDFALSGQPLDPPATWHTLLSTQGANVAGQVAEPPGLSRLPFLNVAKSFRGDLRTRPLGTANSTAITFSAASAPVGTLKSVGLADAATGGNIWAIADMTVPVSVEIGDAPSIAPGALFLSIQ